jgi:predicted oxidoreductase
VVGYIVDLTVIMDGIFRTAAGDMSPNDVERVINRLVSSGRTTVIHQDIGRFITEAFAIRFSVPQKDLVLERIIDLIQQFCVPSSVDEGLG